MFSINGLYVTNKLHTKHCADIWDYVMNKIGSVSLLCFKICLVETNILAWQKRRNEK